jgi:hypothetical protein
MTNDAIDPRDPEAEIEDRNHPSRREHEIRVAPTQFISLARHDLAVRWKTGCRPR